MSRKTMSGFLGSWREGPRRQDLSGVTAITKVRARLLKPLPVPSDTVQAPPVAVRAPPNLAPALSQPLRAPFSPLPPK